MNRLHTLFAVIALGLVGACGTDSTPTDLQADLTMPSDEVHRINASYATMKIHQVLNGLITKIGSGVTAQTVGLDGISHTFEGSKSGKATIEIKVGNSTEGSTQIEHSFAFDGYEDEDVYLDGQVTYKTLVDIGSSTGTGFSGTDEVALSGSVSIEMNGDITYRDVDGELKLQLDGVTIETDLEGGCTMNGTSTVNGATVVYDNDECERVG